MICVFSVIAETYIVRPAICPVLSSTNTVAGYSYFMSSAEKQVDQIL
jgi:hypothetical protein